MKILYVATVQSHIAQFHLGAIAMMKEKGYEIHVAARDNLKEKNGLKLKNVDKVFDIPFKRSPLKADNIQAYYQLKQIITQNKYDIIHCNTPVAGILTRWAARKERGKGTKVIYTAHGFHFYKGAPFLYWVIYYPLEKIMAHLTDVLVTINEEDYSLACRKFKCPVYRMHGVGVNTSKYDNVSKEEIERIKREYNLHDKTTIICTGELNENKNQKTVVSAMKKVIKSFPDTVLLLAGNGPEKDNLNKQIKQSGLEGKVILLGYHTDLPVYVHASDIAVSASLREGLGLNLLEAMYCKKPIVASDNRGHRELIDNKSGYLVNARDSEAFSRCLMDLCRNFERRISMGVNGYKKSMIYRDVNVLNELQEIYGGCNENQRDNGNL